MFGGERLCRYFSGIGHHQDQAIGQLHVEDGDRAGGRSEGDPCLQGLSGMRGSV